MVMYNPLLDDPSFEEVVPWLQHASKIKTLIIGDGITAVDVDAVNICNLTSIRVGVANTRYSVAGDVLFDKEKGTLVCCPRGKTGDYVIPGPVVTIGNGAFKYCAGLTSVTIPGSVTTIGTFAFSGCVGLTDVTIPASVTRFGLDAFSGCSGLRSVTNLSPEPQSDVGMRWIAAHDSFLGIDVDACTLRVPANAVEAYKAHTEWRKFGNIVAI
jgi:hypothetical protein